MEEEIISGNECPICSANLKSAKIQNEHIIWGSFGVWDTKTERESNTYHRPNYMEFDVCPNGHGVNIDLKERAEFVFIKTEGLKWE